MNRDFKGVWIPKEIWLDTNLTALDKVIYTEISSLDNENYCVAGNEYLAEFCGCSERKVSDAVTSVSLGTLHNQNLCAIRISAVSAWGGWIPVVAGSSLQLELIADL